MHTHRVCLVHVSRASRCGIIIVCHSIVGRCCRKMIRSKLKVFVVVSASVPFQVGCISASICILFSHSSKAPFVLAGPSNSHPTCLALRLQLVHRGCTTNNWMSYRNRSVTSPAKFKLNIHDCLAQALSWNFSVVGWWALQNEFALCPFRKTSWTMPFTYGNSQVQWWCHHHPH